MNTIDMNLILYQTLQRVAEDVLPDSYLEIGVREGHSLSAILKSFKPKRIVLCDNWGGDFGGTGRGNHNHIQEFINLNYPDLKKSIRFLDGDSKNLIPKLNEMFDMILVDGDHSEAGAYADLKNTWPLLYPGGALVFDDIDHPAHPELSDVALDFWSQIKMETASMIWDISRPNGVMVIQKKGIV